MNRKEFLQQIVSLGLVIFFLVGCSAPATAPVPATAPAKATATSIPIPQPSATATGYVLVPVDCVVTHSGWEGIVVDPGITKPTSGIVVKLECNGKDVEIANKTIADGYIETSDFGKIGIRFGSQIQTVGAGEYIELAEGISLPQRAIEIYIQGSKVKDFTNRYPK